MFFAPKRSETREGIELRGRPEFLRQTRKSLELLKPTSQFEVIQASIGVIREGRRSGMKAWAEKPTFTVGKPTWRHSALWYAGAIAHDAYHSKLYLDAKAKQNGNEPHADTWTGAEAEKKCLAFQREVLLALDADEKILSYIEACAKNPTYQGRSRGIGAWLDYVRRWW